MLERLDETIVAISSAPGRAALGIVRLSGPETYRILEPITPQTVAPGQGPTRAFTELNIDGAQLPATLYLFRAPRSYTRQDLAEIHTIGATPLLELVREKLISMGAVAARPGEFTARAFFSGAMDLMAAEGVARLIQAQSDTELAAARGLLEGRFSAGITALRDKLAELLGLVEAGIDFAEEPIEFITPAELAGRLGRLGEILDSLQTQAGDREILEPLPRILLLGPPNAGKSSLMNALSGVSRAICAAVAGTTRDILSVPVRLGMQEAILLDSAGIDESPDEVISAARRIALATASKVDCVCIVLDAEIVRSLSQAGVQSQISDFRSQIGLGRFVVALNKCDLLRDDHAGRLAAEIHEVSGFPVVAVSAQRGDGLVELRKALAKAVGSATTTIMREAVIFGGRQREAIARARESISRAACHASQSKSTSQHADVLAFELREALDSLGAVTGEVTTEDLLSQIFANFCIGK